jgi:uncharacterized protein YndB with AHSA1/START domain
MAKQLGRLNMTAYELRITRLFEAPRELVYACFTEPEHLARWGFAPEGLTVDVDYQEIRVGGMFRVRMHSPQGVDARLQGVYRELVKPERISFTHAWILEDGSLAPETIVTISLKTVGNKTELTLTQTGLPSQGSRDGHEEGWNSTFDRLADYLSRGRH